jgi:hypothetical protein
VAVVVFWIKSYFRADLVLFANSRHPPVRSNLGLLYFARNDHQPGSRMEPMPLGWVSHPPDRDFRHPVMQARFPSFVVGMFSLGGTKTHAAFTLPHWSLAALTAITPLLWLKDFPRTRHRLVNRLCPVCGYDLRATPGRCPECGEHSSPERV